MNDLESKTMEPQTGKTEQQFEEEIVKDTSGFDPAWLKPKEPEKPGKKLPKHLGPPDSEQWAFREVKDTSDGVMAVVQADLKCPIFWKSAIMAEIKASGFKGVRLDAQGHRHGGLAVWHVSVSKLF